MGDGKGSASALAHFASCASLIHVSTLRSSRDMVDSPFLGLCGTALCEAETATKMRGPERSTGWRARADLTRALGETATGAGDHPIAVPARRGYRLSRDFRCGPTRAIQAAVPG